VCNSSTFILKALGRRSRQMLLVGGFGVVLHHAKRFVSADCGDLLFTATSFGEPATRCLA
jgi:hypothetical protein